MKKLLVVLGLTLSLMSVKAGTLYWQIESSDSDAFAGLADTVAMLKSPSTTREETA